MLTATRREWNELYVFFNFLAQGGIVLGNEEGLPSGRVLPIFQVTRQEHDGERRYTVEETDIHVEAFPQGRDQEHAGVLRGAGFSGGRIRG